MKKIISLLLILCIISPISAFAANSVYEVKGSVSLIDTPVKGTLTAANTSLSGEESKYATYRIYKDGDDSYSAYTTHDYRLKLGGDSTTYTAFCVKPGASLKTSQSVTCYPVQGNDSDTKKTLNNLIIAAKQSSGAHFWPTYDVVFRVIGTKLFNTTGGSWNQSFKNTYQCMKAHTQYGCDKDRYMGVKAVNESGECDYNYTILDGNGYHFYEPMINNTAWGPQMDYQYRNAVMPIREQAYPKFCDIYKHNHSSAEYNYSSSSSSGGAYTAQLQGDRYVGKEYIVKVVPNVRAEGYYRQFQDKKQQFEASTDDIEKNQLIIDMKELKKKYYKETVDFEIYKINSSFNGFPNLKIVSGDTVTNQANPGSTLATFSVKRKSESCDDIVFNIFYSSASSTTSGQNIIYYCKNDNGDPYQDFMAFAPSVAGHDSFSIKPKCLSIPGYEHEEKEEFCDPAPKVNDFTDVELHNCCDENKDSLLRQAALGELFCDYKGEGMSIEEYKKKTNADDYKIGGSNTICSTYCGSTIRYSLPEVTKSISDRFFSFSKNKNGVEGVVLTQYKRCRTIINYDLWYSKYNTAVDSAVTQYNSFQNNSAKKKIWEYAKANNTTANLTVSYSCSKSITVSIKTKVVESTLSTWTEISNYTGYSEGTTIKSNTRSTKAVSKTYSSNASSAIDHSTVLSSTHYNNSSTTLSASASDSTTSSAKIYTVNSSVISSYPYTTVKKSLSAYTSLKIVTDNSSATASDIATGKWVDSNDYKTADNLGKQKASEICDSVDWTSVVSTYCNTTLAGTNTSCTDSGTASAGTPSHSVNISSYTGTIDPDERIKTFKDSADSARTNFNTANNTMLGLQSSLNDCGGKILSEGKDDSPITARVQFTKIPEMEFTYRMAYTDDAGEIKTQEILIPFELENGNCVTETSSSFKGVKPTDTTWLLRWDIQGWDKNVYDTQKYGTGTMSLVHPNDLPSDIYIDSSTSDRMNRSYTADKKFVTDAAGKMVCKWVDNISKNQYTIVPSGVVTKNYCVEKNKKDCDYESPSSTDINSTSHSGVKLHKMIKTHASGTFETYFTLINVGEGYADDYLSKNGKTCSGVTGKNLNGHEVNATCKFEVDEEVMKVLDCRKVGIFNLNSKTDKCTQTRNGLYVEYKEVDPISLFPNDVNYGYNWKKTTEGQAAMATLESLAKKDELYDPKKITYSFTLTPTDLKQIREYNKSRVDFGGYADFNLDCTIKDGVATKCISRFITAISNGEALKYNGGSLKLNTNNKPLTDIRSKW